MRKFFAPTLLMLSLVAMQGCVTTTSSSEPATARDVYYSEFSSVPIPIDMVEQGRYTNVMVNIDGLKAGSQIFEGPLERQSLVNAMTHNMLRKGWQARSIVSSGERNLMVFQNDSRMAVLTVFEGSTLSNKTIMDVWVAPFLPDGVVKTKTKEEYPVGQDYNTPVSAPAFSVSPDQPSGYGVQEQGLSQ